MALVVVGVVIGLLFIIGIVFLVLCVTSRLRQQRPSRSTTTCELPSTSCSDSSFFEENLKIYVVLFPSDRRNSTSDISQTSSGAQFPFPHRRGYLFWQSGGSMPRMRPSGVDPYERNTRNRTPSPQPRRQHLDERREDDDRRLRHINDAVDNAPQIVRTQIPFPASYFKHATATFIFLRRIGL